MPILNKAAILAAEDLKTETVAVPEWGGEVRVRTLTGTERDAFESGLVAEGGKAQPRQSARSPACPGHRRRPWRTVFHRRRRHAARWQVRRRARSPFSTLRSG